ncbi:hypothetical protein BS78_K077600 [Paspalum vaginatum]|uniref:Uncharacterized protein n=1 Tax=Paspalum vaginatum TaxID=158149 RepID=A0A9W7X932_9POAL|nr:hypothetical protein BS78_K077600 [Paspalum vaginatum]
MADPKLPHDANPSPKPAPSPPPAPRTARRRVPWAAAAILVSLALNFALCVRRAGDDRGAVAFAGLSHLNLLALFGALRGLEASPRGSPARGRARTAVWLLTTTLTAAFTWKIGALLPLPFAAAAWAVAAVTVLGGFYAMFVVGDK